MTLKKYIFSFLIINPFRHIIVIQSLTHVWISVTPWTAACQASLSFTISCSLLKLIDGLCHPTISSSVVPFSSCFQSCPASGYFPMNQLFTSGGQITGASPSASVLPMNIQGWFPLGWTGWISWPSKGISRVFFNTIFITLSNLTKSLAR